MVVEDQLVNGINFLDVKDCIKRKWGTDGLDRFCRSSGFSFDGMNEERDYSFNQYINLIEDLKEEFNDEDIAYKIGYHRSKNLQLVKGMKRTRKEMLEAITKAWPRFNNFASLDLVVHEEDRFSIVMTKYETHPLFCDRMRGFFAGIANYGKMGEFKVEEVKCMNQGHGYCEHFISR